jgi:vancomycin resistance protein YoaR
MTTTTETQVGAAAVEGGRFRFGRVFIAFLLGVLLVAALAVAGVLAYEQAYAGKVAAGVSVGSTDLSGLTRDEAAARLEASYASVGQGTLTLDTVNGPVTLTYAELGRRPDVEAMLDEALAVGRTGNPLERVVEEARTALNPIAVAPRVMIDKAVLDARIAALAKQVDLEPTPAAVAVSTTSGFTETAAVWGRDVDEASTAAAIQAALQPVDAPTTVALPMAVTPVAPTITDTDAMVARSRADRMIAAVVLAHGSDDWAIPVSTVQSWVTFGAWPDGSYGPIVDQTAIAKAVKGLAKKVNTKPLSATFMVSKSGGIVGVKAGHAGRTLDVDGTSQAIQDALVARAGAGTDPKKPVTPVLAIAQPALTTEQAQKSAPLMRRISSWTTYYEPGAHNGFGANITIPSMAINGTVVAPGGWFSYWKTVGEVSLAKGYKLGGAIIDGHSVEGKSIGGGICSSSTTIFNAALRAGLQMGARKNHYYYISRYPKGLDATVFISDGGGAQDMTFRNDTKYPILIRTYAKPGIVRFTIYSVPTGRHVTFSRPIVKNYRPGYSVTRYTTGLRAGVRQTVEYPADGQDVWVTRIVKDRSGKVVHKETFFSHYAQMIGVTLIGKGK